MAHSNKLHDIDARRRRRADAVSVLGEFQVNGAAVFDSSAADLAYTAAAQAHAVLVVLGNAISETIDSNGHGAIYALHIAQCIAGVETLLGLSLFAREAA